MSTAAKDPDEPDLPRSIGGGDATRPRLPWWRRVFSRLDTPDATPADAPPADAPDDGPVDPEAPDRRHAHDDPHDDPHDPHAQPPAGAPGSGRHPLERAWTSLSADLAPAAVRRSRNSLVTRVTRARSRFFFIVQCAVSAAIAWFIAARLLGHAQPFFAPIAALVALGQSFGQRIERVVQIVLGVAVGVFIGDTFVHYFGTGFWQLAVIIIVSMTITSLLGAGVMMVTQSGVQSAFVAMVVAGPDQAFSRWTDAVVGGAVALVAATITPASPLRRPRRYTGTVVTSLADVLADTARALRADDLQLASASLQAARATESSLDRLHDLADDGLAVIRSSPFRRRHLPAVQAIADLIEPLDRAIRNIRVLVRRAVVALREGEPVPKAYIDLIDDLASVARTMATDLDERNLPTGAQPELLELAERTTYVTSRPSLSSEVIRAQVRSTIVDLLMVTGLSHAEALDCIPTSYSLDPHSADTEPLFTYSEDPAPTLDPVTGIDPVTGPLDRDAIDRSLAQRARAEDREPAAEA